MMQTLQKLGQSKSLFAGDLRQDAAVQGLLHVVLPETLRTEFVKVLDEAAQKGLQDIQDAAKRDQAKKLIDALRPTFTRGLLDGIVRLTGPVEKNYTLLAAIQVQDGVQLGTTIRGLIADAIKDVPAAQKDKIQLDAATAAGVKIHRFELPQDPNNRRALEVLGDNNLYVAFRKDAVFFALGKEGLSTLKDAVAVTQAAAAPTFRFDFDVARMVPIIAKTQEQRDLAQKLFKGGDDSRIRFTVTGGPALTARLTMGLNALEFFAKSKGDGQ
jgi:hypothetical protein